MANEDIYNALRNADAAGDTEAAAKIAAYIKQQGNTANQEATTAGNSQPTQSDQPQSDQQPMGWGETAERAALNFVPSLGNMLSGIAQSVRHPIQTIENLAQVGAGAAVTALPKSAQDWLQQHAANPEKFTESLQKAGAVEDFYKNRYGSEEGFKKALAEDPAGVMADLTSVISGGGALAARAGSLGAKVGEIATKAAQFTDPLGIAAKAAASTGKAVGKGAAQFLGTTTGAGAEALKEAYKAGKTGGGTAESFTQNLRGNAPFTDVIDNVKANLADMAKQRADAYRSGMVDISNDKSILDFKPIDNSLQKAQADISYKGQVKNKKAADVVNAIRQEVDDWKNLDPAEYHTPEGIDALKQKIGGIVDAIPMEEKGAIRAGSNIYNSIKNTINNQAPTYAKVMGDYSHATEQIKEIEKMFSLGKKSSTDSAMRKLQSLMRNNANTNYGNRLEAIKQLESSGGVEVTPALAGQALSSVTPRGLQSLGVTGIAGAAALHNPAALALLPLQSPRAMGELSYLTGKAAGTVPKFGELPINPNITANILYQMQQPKGQQQ